MRQSHFLGLADRKLLAWSKNIVLVLSETVLVLVIEHDSKSQESTGGDFGAPHCSCFLSYYAVAVCERDFSERAVGK